MGLVNVIAIVLGLVFVYAGTIKIVPINPGGQGYDHMMKEFERFATVSPLKMFGLDLPPHLYCALVGLVEVICGTLIAFGSYTWRVLSTLDVICIMGGAIYTLYALHEPLVNFVPAVVCLCLAVVVFLGRDGLKGPRPKSKGKQH